jgi:hypothetical protein
MTLVAASRKKHTALVPRGSWRPDGFTSCIGCCQKARPDLSLTLLFASWRSMYIPSDSADAFPDPLPDLVAWDDVHALDDAGQARLFGLLIRMRESGGVLLCAGDVPPARLALRADVVTRLAAGVLGDAEKAEAVARHAEPPWLPAGAGSDRLSTAAACARPAGTHPDAGSARPLFAGDEATGHRAAAARVARGSTNLRPNLLRVGSVVEWFRYDCRG